MAHEPSNPTITESRNPLSGDLDERSIDSIIELMNAQDQLVVEAVGREREAIGAAVAMIVTALKNGGRLFYVGAGTSGRLGMLDAAECPPTFSTDREQVQAMIAGGPTALIAAVEGAEDAATAGAADIQARGVRAGDVVVGISASGSTPYVHGALQAAKDLAAATVLLACNPVDWRGMTHIDLGITPVVGPELISGSTRLKAGTATKMVLNMLSTATMIKLGKVYGNYMVDVHVSNQKLRRRAIGIIQALTGLDDQEAATVLDAARGKVKPALVMAWRQVCIEDAEALLDEHQGHLRAVMQL